MPLDEWRMRKLRKWKLMVIWKVEADGDGICVANRMKRWKQAWEGIGKAAEMGRRRKLHLARMKYCSQLTFYYHHSVLGWSRASLLYGLYYSCSQRRSRNLLIMLLYWWIEQNAFCTHANNEGELCRGKIWNIVYSRVQCRSWKHLSHSSEIIL